MDQTHTFAVYLFLHGTRCSVLVSWQLTFHLAGALLRLVTLLGKSLFSIWAALKSLPGSMDTARFETADMLLRHFCSSLTLC